MLSIALSIFASIELRHEISMGNTCYDAIHKDDCQSVIEDPQVGGKFKTQQTFINN